MTKVDKLLVMALLGTNDQERLTSLSSLKSALVKEGVNITECKISNKTNEHIALRRKILELREENARLRSQQCQT